MTDQDTTDERVWHQIRRGRASSAQAVDAIADRDAVRLGSAGVASLRQELRSEVLGAGPLEPLLADPTVTDVLVNGLDGVWVDRGDGLHQEPIRFAEADSVRRLAVRLATLAGQRLDDASPWVDGLLPGGVRLHGILPPLVAGGAHLSLRIPRSTSPDLATLEQWGMLNRQVAQILREVVRKRVSFVITGGTGSGKTTLLGAMLQGVDPAERIVLVEDTRELAVRHPHVVRLQGRAANVEGRGEVTLTTLVRQSLRMRPDRLVIGEVRGAEEPRTRGCYDPSAGGGVMRGYDPAADSSPGLAGDAPGGVPGARSAHRVVLVRVRGGPPGARPVPTRARRGPGREAGPGRRRRRPRGCPPRRRRPVLPAAARPRHGAVLRLGRLTLSPEASCGGRPGFGPRTWGRSRGA
ncbi:CpaF family protein [Ornithinimicrobium cavernae]|uniref:CpaF family protein n=1 Tax=Ornithinimicrobium cavernae TaxID=2666047 RepID=UPI001F23690C|nr:ATPase, T2SS/T4P/T4SS family [Ornithinimicrobium cavernae]